MVFVLEPGCSWLLLSWISCTVILFYQIQLRLGNLLRNFPMSDCYYELCFLISLLAVKCIHICSKPPYHVCMVLVRRISQYSCQVLLEVLSASFPQLVCDHAQQRAKLEVGFSAINSLYTFNPY